MKELYNKWDKETLKARVAAEEFDRVTMSFYRYVRIEDPTTLRDQLFKDWFEMGVLGRIYLAEEGINAQLSVPQPKRDDFKKHLDSISYFKGIDLKAAVEDDNASFYKLKVKVRKKILGDGLNDKSFDVSNPGQHLNAKEFNEALNSDGTIVVDMRNHYESEIGHFKNAILPESDTFREELPIVEEKLKGKENEKILLYCTGGIRCEKASAWLKHKGFKDVNQLKGGIIQYIKEVKEQGLNCKYVGKNFVFDGRLGERITEDVISTCHQCGEACDTHTNCRNDDCHLLFIQCENCREKYEGCCTPECVEIANLPIEEQRKLRKGKRKLHAHAVYKSRLRPNLAKMLKGK